MSKDQDRSVYPKGDGKWGNRRHDATKDSTVHDTQKDAIDAARDMLKKQGGGELNVHGKDGKIRDKDTVAPGNDPRNVKG